VTIHPDDVGRAHSDLRDVRSALRETTPRVPTVGITAAQVVAAAAARFGVEADDILGHAMTPRPLVDARHVAMAVVRGGTTLSWPAIGRAFDRDHTTVISAVKRVLATGTLRSFAAQVLEDVDNPPPPPAAPSTSTRCQPRCTRSTRHQQELLP
jgi:chromosomal replication initiation ATPase DnaA